MNSPRYKHVMLIDDNEIDILVNKKIIENESFAAQISSASSAAEALQLLKASSSKDSGGKSALPDLILLRHYDACDGWVCFP